MKKLHRNPKPKGGSRSQPSTLNSKPPALSPIRELSLADIDPSATNPRTASGLSDEKIAEIAQSIRHQGLINPLIVRPHPKAPGRFELVCGERRYLAVHSLNLTTVACRVGELSDNDCREIQTVENLQRENLNELEEAAGFHAMLELKDHGVPRYTLESLADRIGASVQTVYARLKLLKAPPKARQAYLDGKLSASVLLLLARIPSAPEGNEATETFLANEFSYRAAKDYVAEHYMQRLKGAPFDQEDEKLCPAAGPCSKCPFRTGNLKKLLPDIDSTDVCTNTACYRRKSEAHAKLATAAAKKDGLNLLPANEGLWQHARFHGDDPAAPLPLKNYGPAGEYIDLDAECPFPPPATRAPKSRAPQTWREALAPVLNSQPSTLNLLATLDPENRLRTLFPRAEALKAGQALGIVSRSQLSTLNSETGPLNATAQKEQALANRRAKQFKHMQRHVGNALVAAVQDSQLSTLNSPPFSFWSLLTDCALHLAGHDIRHEIVNRRELNLVDGKRVPGIDDTDALEKHLKTFTSESDYRALLFEVLVFGNPRHYGAGEPGEEAFNESIHAAAKLLGVSLKKLVAEVVDADQERVKQVKAKKDQKAGRVAPRAPKGGQK